MLAIKFAITSSNFESFPDSSLGVDPFPSEATPFLTRDMMRSTLAKGTLACSYASVASKGYLGESGHKEQRLKSLV